jgi:hypothetical protein
VTEIIKAIMTELKTNKEYLIKVQEVPPDSDYLARIAYARRSSCSPWRTSSRCRRTSK